MGYDCPRHARSGTAKRKRSPPSRESYGSTLTTLQARSRDCKTITNRSSTNDNIVLRGPEGV
eukprot:5673296-Pyramimonas_sp.AAC.1